MIRFQFQATQNFHKGLNFHSYYSFVRQALTKAKQDTMRAVKNDAARLTASEFNVTQQQVKKSIIEETASIRVRSGMLTLDKYKISPTRPRKGHYELLGAVRRGPLKPLGHRAFLRPRKSGGFAPVIRVGSGRGKLKVITGPSIAQLVGNPSVMTQLEDRAQEVFESRSNFYLSKLGIFAGKFAP